MEDFITFKRKRDAGLIVGEDTKEVSSNCNEIAFINLGDWPFYVFRSGSKVKRLVNPGVEQSFGDPRPDTIESDTFSIEFDTVNVGTTKVCGVERVNYEKVALKCAT